jgi:peptide methionine sulfoxide reductase msrA/msrB
MLAMGIRKKLANKIWLTFLLPVGIFVNGGYEEQLSAREPEKINLSNKVLIDDFSSTAEISVLGTRWAFITDLVMSGVSAGSMQFVQHNNRFCLHVKGDVALKNNGGFIEARANLHPQGKPFDARAFEGIYLRAKGNGGRYAIHLRTKDTRLPWQFYGAMFKTDGTWQEIKIRFRRFVPFFLKKSLDSKSIKSIAIVAVNKEFKADIYADEIGFYKEKKVYRKLTPEEEQVIIRKGTEAPFSGKFYNHFEEGTYTCKRCEAELFKSSSKFKWDCGWPSFDDQIEGAVKWQGDADGVRTEIVCAECGAHLGHVFLGGGLTPKNTHHCVNSISVDFVPAQKRQTEKAVFASGCFWGTEYHFQKVPGVISTTVGYTGGHLDNPTYKQVCTDKTSHAEAVEVIYDPSRTTYEQLTMLFFNTHDFTQLNRQGPDVGTQYRSAIFYLNEQQKVIAARMVEVLKQKGYDVKTEIAPAGKFWPAEEYHQDYYKKTGKTPYCHTYKKIF